MDSFKRLSWCSRYHICLTHRRSPVRSRAKTNSFSFWNLFISSNYFMDLILSCQPISIIHFWANVLSNFVSPQPVLTSVYFCSSTKIFLNAESASKRWDLFCHRLHWNWLQKAKKTLISCMDRCYTVDWLSLEGCLK